MEISQYLIKFMVQWTTVFFLLCMSLVLALSIQCRYRKGLRDIPGPFFATFLPLDRIISAASGNQYQTHIEYHKKYGPRVRVGPNHVSFSDTDVIPQIYGIATKFYKSNFYALFDAQTPIGPTPTMFSVRDESVHKALKRPVSNAYSMSTLVDMEPMTDSCISILERKLSGLAGRDIDLGTWLHWYAFDVITEITFSNRMGFMAQEKDVEGIINALEGRQAYNAVVGQAPSLHRFLLGNPVVAAIANWIPALARLNSARFIVVFAVKQLERYKSKDKQTYQLRDMLDRFKRSKDGEELISEQVLLGHAASNIFAGSDTTAISLRSMLYYLCKTPRCYDILVQEIDEMDQAGELSSPITFAESNKTPYLQACMKEAMRMHPAVGQLLERVVQKGGATTAGKWLPEGTII